MATGGKPSFDDLLAATVTRSGPKLRTQQVLDMIDDTDMRQQFLAALDDPNYTSTRLAKMLRLCTGEIISEGAVTTYRNHPDRELPA